MTLTGLAAAQAAQSDLSWPGVAAIALFVVFMLGFIWLMMRDG